MTDDGQRKHELIAHVLDHPCPECRAPTGIECGDPDTWGAGTDPAPHLDQQCPSRVTAGRLLHAALISAVALRRWTRSDGQCPPWCVEHWPLLDDVLHGKVVGTIPTTSVGELHVVVVALLEEPDRGAAIVLNDGGDVVLGRPLEQAEDLIPALLVELADTQRQAPSTRRPPEGGD